MHGLVDGGQPEGVGGYAAAARLHLVLQRHVPPEGRVRGRRLARGAAAAAT